MEKEKKILFDKDYSKESNEREKILKEFKEKVTEIKDIRKVEIILMRFLDKIYSHPIMAPFFSKQEISSLGADLKYKDIQVNQKQNSKDYSSFLDIDFEFKDSPNAPNIKGRYGWCDFDIEKTFQIGNDYLNELTLEIKGENKTYKVYMRNVESRGKGDLNNGVDLRISEE